MKIIVTHCSPDWDAITSVWVLKRFLPGWNDAKVQFVPAGERIQSSESRNQSAITNPIEHKGQDEIIHVDTGMGPLDHHETSDDTVCAASRCWDYVKIHNSEFTQSDRMQKKKEALDRMIKVIVSIDHFKEVFWPDATADYQEFSVLGILEGLKMQKPNQDIYYLDFGMGCLDALVHTFESRIWAEEEIKKGTTFATRFGQSLGLATLNDDAIKLAQKMGYRIVIRKDPRKGYVRIKARPTEANSKDQNIDLTLVYEQLRKMDPEATWYLHVSKKMLLNGTAKNPKMVATKLTLHEIIQVIKNI